MTLDANKALIRSVFEKVIPAGDAAGLRDLVAPDWVDHDPLPGQPAGITFSNTERIRALFASRVIVPLLLSLCRGRGRREQARMVTREGGDVAGGASGERLDVGAHGRGRALP